jgi:hypothetical protein
MIVREEYLREDGVKLTRTYSTENKYIRKVGTEEIYSEAIDVREYEYVETDRDIEEDWREATEEEKREYERLMDVEREQILIE